MKYNKSKIMSRAWSIRRMTGCTMSEALKQSWAQAKAPVYSIKGWFMTKNFDPSERLAIVGVTPELRRETEKAVQLCWDTEYGKIVRWVPKSCFETAESYEAELKEETATCMKKIREREENYNALIAECRAHGIPARKGWLVATMKAKLAEIA